MELALQCQPGLLIAYEQRRRTNRNPFSSSFMLSSWVHEQEGRGRIFSLCKFSLPQPFDFSRHVHVKPPLHHRGLHDGAANDIILVKILCCGKNFNYFNYCF